jgi:hypothetical protein
MFNLDDYKYKDMDVDVASLEKEKAGEWAMYHALGEVMRGVSNSYAKDDPDREHIEHMLRKRHRDINRNIDDIEEKLLIKKRNCKHDWIDITASYDNHDVIKCKKCGNYKV